SFVEEYLGDLKSLENLYEAMIKMSMIAAKVLFLVNPNGVTQVRRLAKANTGDFVAGRKQDVEVFQLEKYADFNIAKQVASDIEARISRAFMLNSSVQRAGERVTAEEIRYVAGELEDTLGGVYSILSQELQLPLVKVLLRQLEATGKVPNLPKEAVEPAVATGLEALGRGHDLKKLEMFLNFITSVAQIQDPDLNMPDLKLRVANSLGIDTTGLLLTDEQKQQKQAELAAQQGMQAGGQSFGAAAGQMGAQAAMQMAQQQGMVPPAQ
ncbi:MAG: portal protein, partial [Aeromonas sp.]